MSDFVTILTHSSLPLAKRWMPDGSVTPYGEGKHFKTQERPLDSIADLSALLSKLEKAPRSCVIRGKYRGEEFSKATEPEHKPGLALRRLGVHDDAPHHWLLIDVDNFVPIGADPVLEPIAAIAEYIGTLPEEFRSASYHWQLSNSAGLPKNRGTLKAHLWFWSETPYTSARLKAWAEVYEIEIDKSLFGAVQPHYTAAPIFTDGVADPVPARSGFVAGATDSVPLLIPADLPAPKQLASKAERLTGIAQSDPVAQHLYDISAVKSVRTDGGLNIECPRSAEHTGESGETTSVYYLAHTNGHAAPAFHCKHEHCQNVPQQVFLDACGYVHDVSADFDVVEDDLSDKPEHLSDKRNKFQPIHAAEFAIQTPTHWLVKGILPAGGTSPTMAVMYGASGSGKSFQATDMACAIARGIPWRDCRTTKGRVAYICAEGAGGYRKRLQAYALHHQINLTELDVWVIPAAPNLLEGDDVRGLIHALLSIGPLALVIVDTLAQATAGGNENSGEDMGKAIGHCRTISEVLHCLVMLVHHSGKDDTKGARGHSSLKAAADTELEVVRGKDTRAMRVSKQKDGEDGQDMGFSLIVVPVGHDSDGDPITSCVIAHNSSTVADARQAGKKLGSVEAVVMQVLLDGEDMASGGMDRESLLGASIAKLERGESIKDRRREVATRALKELLSNGRVKNEDGIVKPVVASD
jgi:hypothetical protein